MNLSFEIKRKIISKGFKPIKQLPKRSKEELLIQGLVVINKPSGPFSYMITNKVKRILKAKKAGHAGTLDPKASGVLPIAFNHGCKALAALRTDKEYECIMHVHTEVPESIIKKTSNEFVGLIEQMPPVKSAVKRAWRKRRVYYLKIIKIEGREVSFIIGCEAGTYIRKVCSDWGRLMNTKAHMKHLVRTKSGPFSLKDSVDWDDFRESPLNHLLPVERAVTHLPWVWINDSAVNKILDGSQLFLPGINAFHSGINKDDLVALMSTNNELVALARAQLTSAEMKGDKGLGCRIERVIMMKSKA